MQLSAECCMGSRGHSQGEVLSWMGNLQQGTSGVREVLANPTQQGLAEGRPGGQTSTGVGGGREGNPSDMEGGSFLVN